VARVVQAVQEGTARLAGLELPGAVEGLRVAEGTEHLVLTGERAGQGEQPKEGRFTMPLERL